MEELFKDNNIYYECPRCSGKEAKKKTLYVTPSTSPDYKIVQCFMCNYKQYVKIGKGGGNDSRGIE